MTGKPYRVDYHVVTNIYFENNVQLSGPDFAHLWSTMKMYGRQRATGGFWHPTKIKDGFKGRVSLGDLASVKPLLKQGGDTPILGGGTWQKTKTERAALDRDFYYAHANESRCFGYSTLPYLLYVISGQWFEKTGVDNVLKNIHEHFRIADKYKPRYGLVDVADSEECYAGMVYPSYFYLNCPFHRWVEHIKWLRSCTICSDRVRGLYWGNYLGTAILNRLGGRRQFLNRLNKHLEFPDGKVRAIVWEFDNGVFVSLNLDPLIMRPGRLIDGIVSQNLQWLIRDLSEHDCFA